MSDSLLIQKVYQMAAENIDTFLNEKRNKKKFFDWTKLKFYGLPVISTSIFVIIVLFFIIPKITEIFSELENVDRLGKEQTELQNLLIETRRLQSNIDNLDAQLSVIDSIAPSRETEVLIFRNKIQQLAESNGLKFAFQVSSDTNLQNQVTNAPLDALSLKEVATQFEVTGEFTNIEQFINQLNLIDDFIIIRQMSLSSIELAEQSSFTEWELQLTIAKYQFNNETDAIREDYLKVDPNQQLDELMRDYINNRIGVL